MDLDVMTEASTQGRRGASVARPTAALVDHLRTTAAPADQFEERPRLSAESRHPRFGAKFYERRCARFPVTYSLDLLSQLIYGVPSTPARGDERVGLGADWVDQVDEARVLPRVLRLAIGTGFPGPAAFGVAEFATIRQFLSRLSHLVFDRLAVVPFHPSG
jgi:hypothetical protein